MAIFQTRVSRWFLTELWVTANLLKSPELFLVFRSISTIRYFGVPPSFFYFQFFQSLYQSFVNCTKFHQVSKNLRSILADLKNAVIFIVSNRPLFPSPPVPVPVLWWVHQEHHLQFDSPSFACSPVFSVP